MRECLLDIMKNSCSIEHINLLKVTGTDSTTTVEAIAENNSVILQAKLKSSLPEFAGMLVGFPNIGKLRTLLNIQEYADNGIIKLTMKKEPMTNTSVPDGLHFSNKTGDFTNSYRFMASAVIAEKSKSVEFQVPPKWTVKFKPTIESVRRFKTLASIHKEEENFKVTLDGTDLIISLGDHSNHAGQFVIQNNISGAMPVKCMWPVSTVLAILALPGDKEISISPSNLFKITVETDYGIYNYLLPANG